MDFALSENNRLTHLIECKLADPAVHPALARFARGFPQAEALQIVRELRQEEFRSPVRLTNAAEWLHGLDA